MGRPVSGRYRHPPTIVSATAAGFGTKPAMFMVVFTAFIGAGIAHIGAEYHKFHHKFGIAGGQAAAHLAKIGTIAAKPDAVPHHLKVVFP
ncbi:hypothetical protein GCM10028803_17470 [Larkinella knui]